MNTKPDYLINKKPNQMEATTIQSLIDKHQRCIDILEAIVYFEQRKKNITESIIEGFYGAFPDLEHKYLNKIDTINRCIARLEQRYRRVIDELSNNHNVAVPLLNTQI